MFIRGVRTPGSEESVATGIGQRYGLPKDALVPRLKSGQFRVKSGIDEATARAYLMELEGLGALAVIVDEHGAELPAAAPRNTGSSLSVAAPTASPQRDTASSLSAARPVEKAPSPDEYQTGLLAAAGGGSAQDLGVLGSGDSLLSLTTVDGTADEPKVATSQVVSQSDEDAFRPPEVEEEIALDLSVPTLADAPKSEGGVGGEVGVPGFVAMDAPHESFLEEELAASVSGKAALARYLWDRPRALLMSAVIVGLVVGFIPAMLYSQFSESSAFADSEKALKVAYADARENGSWDDLPEVIDSQKSALKKSRQSSGLVSILVWLVVAGGLGFVWWRVLPWHLWASDPEPSPAG